MTEAYEPAKEHETEFRDNPNYVIVWCAGGTPATQSRDKFATITEEKTLRMTQPILQSPWFSGYV